MKPDLAVTWKRRILSGYAAPKGGVIGIMGFGHTVRLPEMLENWGMGVSHHSR